MTQALYAHMNNKTIKKRKKKHYKLTCNCHFPSFSLSSLKFSPGAKACEAVNEVACT
jgi:hypothetical protein